MRSQSVVASPECDNSTRRRSVSVAPVLLIEQTPRESTTPAQVLVPETLSPDHVSDTEFDRTEGNTLSHLISALIDAGVEITDATDILYLVKIMFTAI